ncbi:MAG: hypothetical protein QOJ08_754 [Ilumatobacteraceae bacterium]
MHDTRSRPLTAWTGAWGPRILWLAVGLAGAWSVGQALDGRSGGARATVAIVAWSAWGIGVVALMVPSTLGLTVMRMLSALACAAAIVSWAAGASPAAGAVFVACTLIAALSIGSADFGRHCVQASAYGDEHRFLLRPPAAFLPPVAVAALVWVAAVLAATLLIAGQRWIIGVITAAFAVLLTLLVLPRFNALSRRWLVLVPAGVVVHDQIVLAETLMVSRSNLVGVELALEGTEAADFTGPAGGHAVEISMRSTVTALMAPTKDSPRGTALHVQSLIVAPSRPGMVLAEYRYWSR